MLIAELKTQLQNAKDELKAAKMKDVDKQEGADDGTSTTEVELFLQYQYSTITSGDIMMNTRSNLTKKNLDEYKHEHAHAGDKETVAAADNILQEARTNLYAVVGVVLMFIAFLNCTKIDEDYIVALM